MFDIGFAELLIIGVVALIVIGPERLPDAVRTASAWLNRFRRGFNEIKQDVQRELHNDAVLRDLRESGDSLRRETEALRKGLNESLEYPADKPAAPIAPPADDQPAGDGAAVSKATDASVGIENPSNTQSSPKAEPGKGSDT